VIGSHYHYDIEDCVGFAFEICHPKSGIWTEGTGEMRVRLEPLDAALITYQNVELR